MNADTLNIAMTIHLVDGTVHSYRQTDAKLNRKFLEKFEPQKLYAQPYFAIEDSSSVTVFPTARIAWIECRIEPDPHFAFMAQGPSIQKVTRAELDSALAGPEASDLMRHARQPGEDFKGFIVFTMIGDSELIFEIQTKVAQTLDQRGMMNRIYEQPTISLPAGDAGCIFVNPSNLMHIKALPGQPNIAPLAWRAEPLVVSEADECI